MAISTFETSAQRAPGRCLYGTIEDFGELVPIHCSMKIIQLRNQTRDNIVCARCQLADNLWTRGKGLLGRSSLDENEGILLVPGNSIHMFGMKFAIDVIYLTRDDVVTDFVADIGPGKAHVAKDREGAGKPYAALEVAAGTIARVGVQCGDQLVRETVGN